MTKVFFALLALAGIASADLPPAQPSPPRQKLYHETLRPQFHFTARYWDDYRLNPPNHYQGWLNDLNGLVYNDGEYHLFAQRWWSAWLHAISTDLIHWKELPPAFGKGGKFGGTQSGGGVVDRNNCSGLGDGTQPPMIAFWSSTDNLSQCISYSLDKGRTWTKYEKNPVLVHQFRDPKVFWYAPHKKWIMILYGPSGQITSLPMYGFNGENNDAHDLRSFTPQEWTCSAIRIFSDGKVIATDQNGSATAQIDPRKQNISDEKFRIGAKTDDSEFLRGDIAEILVYDRPLSDEETKNAVEALRAKWGLAESNPAPQIPTRGLVLRLDAAQAAPDDRNAVSSWKDLSGRANNLTQTETDKMPKLAIDKNLPFPHRVLRFDGAQFLQGPPVLAEADDDFTFVALWRRDNADGSQVICEQNAAARLTGRRACLLSVPRKETENVYLLFTSKNLLEWKKLDTEIRDSFECPDMFQLPVQGRKNTPKWIVIDGAGQYVIGDFDGNRFTPETEKRKGDHGRNFYATMTFENMPDTDPRRIQLAWMRGWDDYPKNMPFNQQVTFPCRLTLRTLPHGIVMCRYPIREIETIRTAGAFGLEDTAVEPSRNPLAAIRGELFDIEMEIDVARSRCSQILLELRGNTVAYDLNRKILSSVGSEVPLEPRRGRVQLRILMDRLSIETFGNRGEVAITNIAYQNQDTPHLKFSAVGGNARILSLTVHNLTSIWK
ncbi:MAG: GH32 C-terminal domain-containing protein [Sedimentisphaerales bacterium]|nr:GH32 C-terminal domain-containing protein [Sedimentisphaerales bacterium]